ncbi:right-handed parallel beta-helix repeat-containing protein [Halosquirtibacter xylanolyticus]|uniref:right-handed parallel beta-helix repeat-containing protein n=1 Tax=Halosquirtibacter xylanolyticus TaxID=3374599 RepID=UPI00374A506E|nr:right-handed parallel beta-helix repeat-containing protein [Prolixibacteraceae bacterium]
MKKCFILLIALMGILSTRAENQIYVSPNGNDKAKGTLEAPYKSLQKVSQRVKYLVRKQPNEDITVYLRGGRYQLNHTLVLGLPHTLKSGKKLTFAAYQDEEPILSSGKNIAKWTKVKRYPKGTPKAAKGKLWVANMPTGLKSFRTLFDGDHRLSRAKSDKFQMPRNEEVRRADSQNTYYNRDRIHLRMFPFTNQIKDWSNLSDVEVFFNPVPWNINMIQLESVDMEKKIAYLAYEANALPFSSGKHRYAWVENVVDYLDEPGEWCVNTQSRKIYYWPKSGTPSKTIFAPQLMELVKVEGEVNYDLPKDTPAKNIYFKGLTFTHGDRTVWYKNRKGWGIQHDWDTFDYGNALLRFRGAESCGVEACHFTNSGGSAMRLDLHAQNIKIERNLIDYVGHMGILLAGYGPGTKDVNKDNTITNNIIHHCGQIVYHGHAIFAWQSGGNVISHNYIHDVPRKAVGICGVRCQILLKDECNFDEASRTIRWGEVMPNIDSTKTIIQRYAPFLHARNNIIEYNRVERTLLKLSDGSSLNVSGAGLGNVVRNNYLYDIPYVGIRTDDWQDGTLICNNLLVNVKNIGIIHKGINTIENNILINCGKGIHFRAYPQQYFEPTSSISHNIFYNTSDKYVPNTTFKWGRMFVHKEGKKSIPYEYQMDYNCYYWPNAKEDVALKQKNGIEEHAVIMDPKFTDLKHFDYRMKNKKLIKKIGFKPFDVSISNYGVSKDYPQKYLLEDNKALAEIKK